MRRFSTFVVAAILVASMAAIRSGVDAPAVRATQSAAVSMVGNRFVPDAVVVAAGTTVTWVNEDYESGEWHDVIAENGAFISESFPPGAAFSLFLDVPGTYTYYCDLHEGMFGRIVVQ